MKTRNLFFSVSLLAAVGLSSSLHAQILTWDPDQTGTGSNGDGDWDNATTNWATGPGNVAIEASAQTSLTVALASGVNTLTVANPDGLAVGQTLSTDRFPAGTVITGIAGDVITLSNNSTNTHSAGQQIFFSQPASVVFGAGGGAAGTVTVSGTQAADGLTLNAATGGGSHTFNGGSITVSSRNGSTAPIVVNASATFNSALNWRNMTFSTAGQTVTLAGGSTAGSAIGAFNGNVGGSSDAIARDSTLAITAGSYAAGGAGNSINIGDAEAETGGLRMSGGAITVGGNFQVGTDGGRNGFAYLTGGTINSQGQFTIGRNNTTTTGKVVVDGGAINQTGGSTTDTNFAISRNNGVGTLEVRGGSVRVTGNGITGNAGGIMVLNADGNNAAANGTLLIGGGTVLVKELRLNGGNNVAGSASNGSSNVIMTGGSLYIGGTVRDTPATTRAGGIVNSGTGSSTYSIDFSNATIGANADWSSDLDMVLSGGVTTFKAAEETTATGHDIALSGVLSGNGGLNKSGAGTLTLTGDNAYAGGTTVAEGILLIDGSHSGNGPVDVGAGATLGGSGFVSGAVNVTGVLAPGNSIESFGTGDLSFLTGSTFAYELDGNALDGDLVHSTGTLDIADGTVLTLTELASGTLSVGSKLTLISYTGGDWTGGLFTYLGDELEDDSTFTLGSNEWFFDYDDTAGGNNFAGDQSGATRFVTMTVIPEPSVALLGGFGLLALLRRRREV